MRLIPNPKERAGDAEVVSVVHHDALDMRRPIGNVDQSGKAQNNRDKQYEAIEVLAKSTIYAARCAQDSHANEHTRSQQIWVLDLKDICRMYAKPTA